MKAITTIRGQAVPLDRANVDTDQIIPKQYLKSIKRTGFGAYVFDAWRFEDEGELGVTPNERTLKRDFVLNQAAYQGANILLARENFGCGSSREHAVWALAEYGFACVIAPSFADIFYNNACKNGLLPVILDGQRIDQLFEAVVADPAVELSVALATQEVRLDGQLLGNFSITVERRNKLLRGLDDIELTLQQRAAIEAFEARHRERGPWLFGGYEGALG